MTLNGTIKGLKKGTVYLQTLKDSSLITLDSVLLNGDDSFSLSTDVSGTELLHLYIDKVDGTVFNDRVIFFAEKGQMSLNTHLNKFNQNIDFTGGKAQDVFEQYKKAMTSIDVKLSQHNFKLIQAQLNDNQDEIESLNADINKLLSSKYLRSIQFALNHKSSVIAAYIGAREIPEANQKYLDTIYNSLSLAHKNSTYGKELKALIK